MRIQHTIDLLEKYSSILEILDSKKSDLNNIEKLIKILSYIHNEDLNYLEKSLKTFDSSQKTKTSIDFKEFSSIYNKKSKLNYPLNKDEEQLYNNFIKNNKKINYIINYSQKEIEDLIVSKEINNFTINEIKFIAKNFFDIDLGSIKLKSEIINILRRQFSQQQYFENISSMYKKNTFNDL